MADRILLFAAGVLVVTHISVAHGQSSVLYNTPAWEAPAQPRRYVRPSAGASDRYGSYPPRYESGNHWATQSIPPTYVRQYQAAYRQQPVYSQQPAYRQQPAYSQQPVYNQRPASPRNDRAVPPSRFGQDQDNGAAQPLDPRGDLRRELFAPRQGNGGNRFPQPAPRGFAPQNGRYAPDGLPIRRLRHTGYYVPAKQLLQIRKHSLVTVRVDVVARTQSEGNSEMRRTANYDLSLTDWIVVNWFRWIKPSPQSDGDPRVAGTLNRQNRAEGDLDTSERLQFNIATEVRDIYPNGNLLLGGSNDIIINNEIWKVSLSGICRPQDIGPNNTVLSSNIFNLRIHKQEKGQVRDAYRRGWFTRWFDRFHPF